jgi:hypothetical protein
MCIMYSQNKIDMKLTYFFAIGVLLFTTIGIQSPSYAAKRNWLKYCQSSNIASRDRAKCAQLMRNYNETMDAHNRTLDKVYAPLDFRPTCNSNQDPRRDNCTKRSY